LLIVRPIKLFAPADNWPTRLRRNVKSNERMICFENFQRGFLCPVSFCQSRNFIFEHIGEPFDEDKRQNVILEFWRVFFAANLAGGVPQHLLHRFGRKNRALRSAALSPPWSFNLLVPKSELTLTDFFEESIKTYSR